MPVVVERSEWHRDGVSPTLCDAGPCVQPGIRWAVVDVDGVPMCGTDARTLGVGAWASSNGGVGALFDDAPADLGTYTGGVDPTTLGPADFSPNATYDLLARVTTPPGDVWLSVRAAGADLRGAAFRANVLSQIDTMVLELVHANRDSVLVWWREVV